MTGLLARVAAARARRRSNERVNLLSRLKVLVIVAPVVFLALFLYMVQGPFHHALHNFPGNVLMFAILSVVVWCFTLVVFAVIERLERRVLRQNEHLSVLNEIAAAAAETLDLDAFLGTALGKVLDVTRAEAGLIWLVEDGTGGLALACHRGLATDQARDLRRATCARDRIAEEAVRTGRPCAIERLLDDPAAGEVARRCGFRSAIGLPLKAEGGVYGVLGVITRHDRVFDSDEIELLSSIAGEVGLAARNARLRERVLDQAVLEERERLGRELHDSLGQMVGYVNTQTLAVKKLLASGCREEAEKHLAALEESSQRVSTDVREAILGLRTNGRGLLPSLRMYLADWERIADTRILLETEGEDATRKVRASTAFHVMRIVQEALSNVRKHAAATTAIVTIGADEDELRVEIADDGVGFDRDDPASTAWPHFGLETMRERAEAIGGTFSVDSRPAVGTTVSVRVPLVTSTEAAHARAAR